MNKTNENLPSNNISAMQHDNISAGAFSNNVSRNGSFLNQARPNPQPRKPSYIEERRGTLFGIEFNFQENVKAEGFDYSYGVNSNDHSLIDIDTAD